MMKTEEQADKPRAAEPIVVDDGEISLEDLLAVAFAARPVHLSTERRWREKLQEGRLVIERSLAAGHKIYGVSTGVGYSSGQTIDADHTHEFAYQIIRQHGCGLGAMLTVEEGRAVVFARLVSQAKGY